MIACPEQDLLEAYRLGTCSDAESSDVRLHLDTCSHCRSRMQVIDDDDEAIVVAVRRVMQHERTPPPLESTLGHYRILRRLGAGGMGVVYEAEQERPRRRVAIKVLRAGLGRILFRAGRPDEAKVTLMEALELGERVLPAEHPFFPSTQRRISNVHRAQGELVEAERWERKAIELLAHRRVDSADRLGAERDLIEILIEQGRTRDARTALEARLARLTEAIGADDARTIATRTWLDELNGKPEAGR